MKANERNGLGRRGGSIVITSSNAAEVNEAIVGVPYMAAKAGVKHFMRHAAYELAAYGIRVNAIAPGPFVTNIGDGWVKKNPAAKAAWDKMVPVGRMAETYQIKPLALLLASDAGSYMTGAHVMIDGGMQLGTVKPDRLKEPDNDHHRKSRHLPRPRSSLLHRAGRTGRSRPGRNSRPHGRLRHLPHRSGGARCAIAGPAPGGAGPRRRRDCRGGGQRGDRRQAGRPGGDELQFLRLLPQLRHARAHLLLQFLPQQLVRHPR